MPFPKGWNKTVKDLMEQDRISPEELDWAHAYEREVLLKDAVFPLDGDIFQAVTDVEIDYLTHWSAPFTGGDDCILPAGTLIKVEVSQSNPEPIGVYATPINYEEMEQRIISEEDRDSEDYCGYSLFINTKSLNDHFKRQASGDESDRQTEN
jgi:hypothetical protein